MVLYDQLESTKISNTILIYCIIGWIPFFQNFSPYFFILSDNVLLATCSDSAVRERLPAWRASSVAIKPLSKYSTVCISENEEISEEISPIVIVLLMPRTNLSASFRNSLTFPGQRQAINWWSFVSLITGAVRLKLIDDWFTNRLNNRGISSSQQPCRHRPAIMQTFTNKNRGPQSWQADDHRENYLRHAIATNRADELRSHRIANGEQKHVKPKVRRSCWEKAVPLFRPGFFNNSTPFGRDFCNTVIFNSPNWIIVCWWMKRSSHLGHCTERATFYKK